MSSMTDWQDYTQWQGVPLAAGSFALTGVFQDLVSVGALGSYQALLCYVSPGGASGVQLTFVYSLADTGAGVVTWSRTVYCPPGQASLFTVPALTNQVRIRARSIVNVSADIAIWPTNAYPRYGPSADGGVISSQAGLVLPGGTNSTITLPVWAGVAKLFVSTATAGGSFQFFPLDASGAVIGGGIGAIAIPVGNTTYDVALGLGWNILFVSNPTAGAIGYSYGLTPWLPI